MRSENGWPVSSRMAAINVARVNVPGTKRYFYVRREAAPLFAYIARRIDREVARIDAGTFDEWGYAAPLRIPGTNVYSNHGSGTAIDVNATRWPWKLRRMSRTERAKVRKIVKACGGQIRWGGDYRSTVDEMHFELAPGTTVASVKRQVARMNLRPDGTRKPVFTLRRTLRRGMTGDDVAAWRKELGQKPGRKFTRVTKVKTQVWRWKHNLKPGKGVVGPAVARKAGWRYVK